MIAPITVLGEEITVGEITVGVNNAMVLTLKFRKKRNVRMKIVASESDQCVWPVGVVAGCGHWVGH